MEILRLQVSIKNLLLLTTIAAISTAWWYDHQRLAEQIHKSDQAQIAFGRLRERASIGIDRDGEPIRIDFGSSECVDQDVSHVRDLPSIREVNLAYCHHISDKAIEHLLYLPELEILYLYRNNPNWVDRFKSGIDLTNQPRITDKSLETIAKIQSLRELYLWDNQFSDIGILQLRSLPNLRKLVFRSQLISESAVAELKQCLPNTEIIHE